MLVNDASQGTVFDGKAITHYYTRFALKAEDKNKKEVNIFWF